MAFVSNLRWRHGPVSILVRIPTLDTMPILVMDTLTDTLQRENVQCEYPSIVGQSTLIIPQQVVNLQLYVAAKVEE